MRCRSTWNTREAGSKRRAGQPPAIPGESSIEIPASNYGSGNYAAWGEGQYAGHRWKDDGEGYESDPVEGFPAKRKDTDRDREFGDRKYDAATRGMQAAYLQRKSLECTRVAEVCLGKHASDEAIENIAVAMMGLPDEAVMEFSRQLRASRPKAFRAVAEDAVPAVPEDEEEEEPVEEKAAGKKEDFLKNLKKKAAYYRKAAEEEAKKQEEAKQEDEPKAASSKQEDLFKKKARLRRAVDELVKEDGDAEDVDDSVEAEEEEEVQDVKKDASKRATRVGDLKKKAAYYRKLAAEEEAKSEEEFAEDDAGSDKEGAYFEADDDVAIDQLIEDELGPADAPVDDVLAPEDDEDIDFQDTDIASLFASSELDDANKAKALTGHPTAASAKGVQRLGGVPRTASNQQDALLSEIWKSDIDVSESFK